MSRLQNLYTGQAGQAAVMAEFLIRGYNVAVPEVDRGDDLFVVHDTDGAFWRVQVKTALGKVRRDGTSEARFSLPMEQLQTPQLPELTFIFAVRARDRWTAFVVIGRRALNDLHAQHPVGTLNQEGQLIIRLVLDTHSAKARQVDLSRHLNDFSAWPAVQH